MTLYAGVDFSGDVGKWDPGCSTSNVWVAEGALDHEGQLSLLALRRVQGLPGAGVPFERLAHHLRNGGFAAVGIDAPYSVPAQYMPSGSHDQLVRLVSGFQRRPGKPFAKGSSLVKALLPESQYPNGLKVYRKTEDIWRRRGLAVRSTLWDGPRGGAPFTVACLTLLQSAGLPLWPWSALPGRLAHVDGERRTILAEAFPAGQLCIWGLPYAGYGKHEPEQRAVRMKILQGIKERGRLSVSRNHAELMAESPDPLDAVLCIYDLRVRVVRR